MNTIYKSQHIISPFQVKEKRPFSIQGNQPVEQAVKNSVGTYDLTATFEEDTQTLGVFKHVPGLISYICTLKRGGEIIGIGRGSAVFTHSNKYLERTIRFAWNAAFIDSVVRSTKMLEALPLNSKQGGVETGEAYRATNLDASESATEKQLSYLRQLVQINVEDEAERESWVNQFGEMTKEEASSAIQSFAR